MLILLKESQIFLQIFQLQPSSNSLIDKLIVESKAKKTRWICRGLVLTFFALNIPIIMNTRKNMDTIKTMMLENNTQAAFPCSRDMSVWFVLLYTTIMCFLPALIITVCSIAMVIKTKYVMGKDLGMASQKAKRFRKMTFLLVLASLAFLVLTLPFNISLNYFGGQSSNRHSYIPIVSRIIALSNNVVNFPLYCLASNTFRREFLRMVGLKPADSKSSASRPNRINVNVIT